MISEYADILELPHHSSTRHKKMSLEARAAQFAPFAALTGFDSAIEETGRLTDQWRELEEFQLSELDWIQQWVLETEQPMVTVTYFAPDSKKSGGEYLHAVGKIKRIDPCSRMLLFSDGKKISLDHIVGIET